MTVTLDSVEDPTGEPVIGRLESAGLPTVDIADSPGTFYRAKAGTEMIGIGGLEVHGEAGLLRSIVIDEAHRGQGYGRDLVRELEQEASTRGVTECYLLTETAAPFFRGLGYVQVDRETAPPALQETSEFADLCGETAVCMRRRVTATHD